MSFPGRGFFKTYVPQMVCDCAYVVFATLVNEVYVKGGEPVPLMPCLVRSEMDGRCSTSELLSSHTVSFSLHSHPSSLPWCLPLAAASSGPTDQSHGHSLLLQTAREKKN